MAPGPMAAMIGYTDIGSSGTFCAWCVAVPTSYCRFLPSRESWCSIWRNDGVSRYESGLLIITWEWFYSFILYFPWFNRYIRTWFFSDISSALSRLYSQCRIDELNPILFSALFVVCSDLRVFLPSVIFHSRCSFPIFLILSWFSDPLIIQFIFEYPICYSTIVSTSSLHLHSCL